MNLYDKDRSLYMVGELLAETMLDTWLFSNINSHFRKIKSIFC